MSQTLALYTNHKGTEVTHASYSARQTFKNCPRQFELSRVHGWYDKGERAAPVFGKCVESAVEFFEKAGRPAGAGVARFEESWSAVKTLLNFDKWQYTESEGDWESLLRAGREMLLLYELRCADLPITTQPPSLWQQNVRKKIFPGTELDKLENKAIFDVISFPIWDHVMLPKIERAEATVNYPNDAPRRTLIIDMKTSGEDLNTELVALDPQLGEYAWQARVPDVAFLWFVKKSHEVKKGSRVSLLQDVGQWRAGFELVVLWAESPEKPKRKKGEPDWNPEPGGETQDGETTWQNAGPVETPKTLYLGTLETMGLYDSAQRGVKGKALKELKAEWAGRPDVARAQPEQVTKQRLQFAAARLTDKQMNDVGRSVAQTTVEMVRAHREEFWPQLAGVRFPNQKCNFCSMRGICLNNDALRDEMVHKRGEEWLDAEPDNEVV